MGLTLIFSNQANPPNGVRPEEATPLEVTVEVERDQRDRTFLPVFLATMTRAKLTDFFAFKVLAAVSQWDYVADPDSIGTII